MDEHELSDDLSRDPRLAEVVERLRIARDESVAAPRAEFRNGLRAQLVSMTPQMVAEAAAENAPELGTDSGTERTVVAPKGVAVIDRPAAATGPRSGRSRRSRAAIRRIPLARPLAVAASVIVLLALVLGGAVWFSRDSVPGDTLYGLKRTGENVRLAFAGSDTDRAADRLEFAQTRVDEARTLVGRASALALSSGGGALAAGRISDETAARVAKALADADDDTRQATSLLGSAAVDSASPGPLASLPEWTTAQLRRLGELRAAVPSNATVDAATQQSATLVRSARDRAAALARRVDCNCLRGGPSDALGPLPVPAASPPALTPASPVPSSGTTKAAPSRGGATSSRTTAPPAPRTRPSTQAPTRSDTPRAPLPSLRLPSRLPSRLPTLPTTRPSSGDSCKINVLGVRVCASASR